MKGIWRGEDDVLGLHEGKVYEILGTEFDGLWYSVIDESGEDYIYPAEDFEILE